jgi:hypothetical protein
MFLGFANYFKRFLPDFADFAYPSYQLLKTDVPRGRHQILSEVTVSVSDPNPITEMVIRIRIGI